MTITRDDLLLLAETSNEESDLLDFKSEYSPEKKAAFWAETIKDIIAFANTKGGVIVFGVDDNGTDSGADCTSIFSLDSATLVDQIRKYTNHNFSDFSVSRVVRSGKVHPIILIEAISVPMVFTKVGTYEISKGKQKTAFSLGTIYFRHGSKSEPCTRDDISETIQRELERIRSEWMKNIRRVVEADPGSTVIVANTSVGSTTGAVRITNDPDAPVARLPRLSDGYPHRQLDVINRVNAGLSDGIKINSHDIQTVKLFEGISTEATPQYMHKPHLSASPQYTEDFVRLLLSRCESDPSYFGKCREHWKQTNYD